MPEAKPIRKSEEKKVLLPEENKTLFCEYESVIKSLEGKFNPVWDDEFTDLVNFKKNKSLPIHRWFDYKEGYSEDLVNKLLDYAKVKKGALVLDPFVGVGTTLVVAQSRGLKSIGLDINPVASFASKVKTAVYSDKEIVELKKTLNNINNHLIRTKNIPKFSRLESIFTKKQLEQILSIKGFYESIPSEKIAGIFKLAYLSIIEDVSNRVKDGNGIKISKTKTQIEDVIGRYTLKVKSMIEDIEGNNCKGESIVIHGSILEDSVFKKISNEKVSTTIFSPPYANCFDYCEVYKMEIWLGDFVKEYSDFTKYREKAIRSHVNSKFSHDLMRTNQEIRVISELIGTYNLWNKKIPMMLRGYFDDMEETLSRISSMSLPGATCSIVVANSVYKGVVVPTDLLLADIAEHHGFKVDKIIVARRIRSSSQQMTEVGKNSKLMRESIIILRKND
ncbi:MAG: DNA methyltransferase [bacterium]